MPELCGRATKNGTCKIPLSGGRCMTHDSNLSKRNRKVARSFKKNNPEAFAEQRSQAGKKGYIATGGRLGWEIANEKARQYRLAHPSKPEQTMIDEFSLQGINHYQRELIVDTDGTTVDFGWTSARCAIEIEGYRVGGFGNPEARRAKQDAKVIGLEQLGWTVLRYDPNDTIELAVEFARIASAKEASTRDEELPF